MGGSTYFLFYSLVACVCLSRAIADDGRKAYVVYMGSLPDEGAEYTPSRHVNVLQRVLDGSISPENSIIKSFKNSFDGFVAMLTEAEKERLSRLKGVVSVFRDEKLRLQTTRSWDFTGLPLNVERRKTIESDIIIGVLDTGIWPESESFKDDGFGPIPKKWKGDCPKSFPCNRKLVGARDLTVGGNKSNPRDGVGHGTHTASIAAGSIVNGASFFGVANGSARGAVPSSRIAAYKVCEQHVCSDSNILHGFDDAIKDGVDIITISMGSVLPREFWGDSISIGAFHASEKGILTVHSAGNGGPVVPTASVSPWLFSVAASFIDRRIVSNTVLGNGKTLIGYSVNSDVLKEDGYSLFYGKDATSSCSPQESSSCASGCLDSKLVKGEIVICDDLEGLDEAMRAGAVGSITTERRENVSSIYALPASALDLKDFAEVLSYYNQSKSARGTILKTETLLDSAPPTVAYFSSRGPNLVTPDILKPDITAPGVDILAAFSPKVPPSGNPDDKRSANFSILSGTSMSCPHVAGAAAYVKSFRPSWSPSAIKSALMTTARAMSPSKNACAKFACGEFAYGSGHLNPVKALHPGLVYETDTDGYVSFLCKMGYSSRVIRLIVGKKTAVCDKKSSNKTSPVDLNYPSLSAKVNLVKPLSIVFRRTVTNVGAANSTYRAIVSSSPKIKVKVQPSSLSFKSLNEKKSFSVRVEWRGQKNGTKETASLTWFDGFHRVRSPIVLYQKGITL